jgi:trimethylamine--corrinoid protein Co-methyltransferase
MLKGFLNICSDEDLKKIHNAAFKILEEVGLKVPSDMLLEYLESYGAKVDKVKRVAKFPPEVVEQTIDLVRKTNSERKDTKDVLITREMTDEFTQDFGYECFFLYDWDRKERRRGTKQDVIEMIHLGDALEEVTSVGLAVLDSGTDQRIEAIEACELLYLHTKKHRGSGIRSPEQVKYFIDIDKILGYGPSNTHFVQIGRCMISPLNLGSDAVGIFEALIKNDYTEQFWIATMPISGATSPVTTAGNIALATAEILGAWSLIKAINKDARTEATIISGAMDMRTGKAVFGGPEAVLQDTALWQLFTRLYQARIGYDPGGYTDAKVPGIQAAFEKTFKQMAFGMLAGLGLTMGTLDGAKTFSPEQAILDLESNKAMWSLFKGVEVNEETVALEQIKEVCLGEGKTFLDCEHTVKHFRDALWIPELLDRTMWEDDQKELLKEKQLLQRANEKWKRIVKQYVPPEVDSSRAKAIHEVVERARRELLK